MQLGALGTVASVQPKNLVIIVWDNGSYQITGSQPTLTSSSVDLVAVAQGAGLAQSAWASDESHFEALVDQALAGDGPRFICCPHRQPAAGRRDRARRGADPRPLHGCHGRPRELGMKGQLLIAGQWVAGAGSESLKDKFDGAVYGEMAVASPQQVTAAWPARCRPSSNPR